MWYLQQETLLILAAFSVLSALLRRFCPKKVFSMVLPLLSLAALFVISKRLCVFYMLYLCQGAICAKIIRKWPKAPLFILSSILAVIPFVVSRIDSFGFELPFLFVSIGLAYAMLKIIDVYYYVYYTKLDVDLLVFANFILFLPVFTAGPIFRYRDFIATHENPLKMDGALLTVCFKRIIWGLFEKIILVRCAMLVMERLLLVTPHWYISAGIIACSYLALFFDLSGYSNIAIAFGKIAGYDVPENFKKPWEAASFTKFWRSWHATFSDWIREHIFIVVGRRKLSRPVSALIALLTMVIMGLWHGFSLPFLIAGIYNGVLLAVENLLSLTTVNRNKTRKPVYVLRCFCVNFLFAINTIVFTLGGEQLLAVLGGMLRL